MLLPRGKAVGRGSLFKFRQFLHLEGALQWWAGCYKQKNHIHKIGRVKFLVLHQLVVIVVMLSVLVYDVR